jgi:hypothetical protein
VRHSFGLPRTFVNPFATVHLLYAANMVADADFQRAIDRVARHLSADGDLKAQGASAVTLTLMLQQSGHLSADLSNVAALLAALLDTPDLSLQVTGTGLLAHDARLLLLLLLAAVHQYTDCSHRAAPYAEECGRRLVCMPREQRQRSAKLPGPSGGGCSAWPTCILVRVVLTCVAGQDMLVVSITFLSLPHVS